MSTDVTRITDEVKRTGEFLFDLRKEIGKVIVGQESMVERLLVGLLADGHILMEGVPGLAKTLSVTTLSQAIQTSFRRIQFTPDLLPADLVGTMIYNPQSGAFSPKKGPIFANIVLADEINRAPAKVQSALLEAMQERQVTIGDATYRLDAPFLVLATQNPIEQEGTYPLPEAQVDRFMLKLKITYPNKAEEKAIMARMADATPPKVTPVVNPSTILEARQVVRNIYIDEKVSDYILDIVFATRKPSDYGLDLDDLIEYGASPRASIYLNVASKALAFLQGRGYVTPQDVKSIGMDVLRHRVIVSYEAEAEEMTSETVLEKIFREIRVP